MLRSCNYINNNRGVGLIPTMIVLFIATIIGIAASSTSVFEVRVASNDKMYKQNFFRADGTNQLSSQLIENSTDNELQERTHSWLALFTQPPDWYIDESNWCTPAGVTAGDCIAADINGADGSIANTRYMVVDHGAAPGAEISMGSPYMHEIGVMGDTTTTRLAVGWLLKRVIENDFNI